MAGLGLHHRGPRPLHRVRGRLADAAGDREIPDRDHSATFACVFVSALGDKGSTLLGSFILAVGISVFGVLLFSYLLQVSMPAWRWGAL